jgi:glycosyltransferase involved in cell wall biosynthesis
MAGKYSHRRTSKYGGAEHIHRRVLVCASLPIDEFTRSVGWCSLTDLPWHHREADMCLVPTIAQDSLSRASFEAMVSAFRSSPAASAGLPCTVTDGVTGLLIEPGDPADLARKISRSLDDPESRQRIGKELVSVHFSTKNEPTPILN